MLTTFYNVFSLWVLDIYLHWWNVKVLGSRGKGCWNGNVITTPTASPGTNIPSQPAGQFYFQPGSSDSFLLLNTAATPLLKPLTSAARSSLSRWCFLLISLFLFFLTLCSSCDRGSLHGLGMTYSSLYMIRKYFMIDLPWLNCLLVANASDPLPCALSSSRNVFVQYLIFGR